MNVTPPSEVRQFIAAYANADERFIRFDWNGRHGKDLADPNLSFRKSVLDAVLADIPLAPMELVRDLYRAETRFSHAARGIDRRVRHLGEQLLRHGGDRFIEDYIDGMDQSFDAFCGTAFDCDPALGDQLLRFVGRQLQTETDARKLALLHLAEKRFQQWANRAP
jgi:hypothetical protein